MLLPILVYLRFNSNIDRCFCTEKNWVKFEDFLDYTLQIKGRG